MATPVTVVSENGVPVTLVSVDGQLVVVNDITAADVENTPAGTVSATTVQAAINEIAARPVEHPGFVAGNWYMPIPAQTGSGGVVATLSVRLLPFFVRQTVTISDLGCRVVILAAGGNCQLAIYANNPTTFRPTGAPLASTGNISTAAAGNLSADIAGANVQLAAGWYWMAVTVDATAGGTVVFLSVATAFAWTAWAQGVANLANIAGASTTTIPMISAPQATYGTWPDLTAATFTEAASNLTALVFFKVASVP